MVLDFITSRWLMIVAGLLLAGAAVGLHDVFTAVPERVNFDRFAHDWASPIVDAFKGTGSLGSAGEGRRIEFTLVDTQNIARLPYYNERPFLALIYRDAVLLEFKDEIVRIELPRPAHTHLWYATNADTYDDEEQRVLDLAVSQPMVVDFTQDLLIQRGANATGVQQYYIYQRYAQVAPPICSRVEYLPAEFGIEPKASCADGALFRMVDSRGMPVYLPFDVDYDDTLLDVTVTQRDPTDESEDAVELAGMFLVEGEPVPIGAPGVRRLFIYSVDEMGAALRIDHRVVDFSGGTTP